jgi:Mn-dependent DtxR family transcriptional regulator
MRRDDLVSVARDGSIDLTRKGRTIAERMALRHQLAEMLLTDVIGLPWSKAHDEAERLEHAISPEVEALLLKRFADKKSCPHGVPLRGGFAKPKTGRGAKCRRCASARKSFVCMKRSVSFWSLWTSYTCIPARKWPFRGANMTKR